MFGFSLHLAPQTIFIPQRILRDITKNVLRSSCKVLEISVWPVPKRKFYENLFTESHDVPHELKYEQKGGWAGRMTWLGHRFLQLFA
jgi:streptogramin lyase